MTPPLSTSFRLAGEGGEFSPSQWASASSGTIDRPWPTAFLADWTGATFVHFALPACQLQAFVPFPLDLYNGEACVSLVAFTMEHMRPGWLDCPLGEWLLRPIAPCRFLNVRTYVRVGSRRGIFFLGEWLSRWANIPLGPLAYGLPYRAGFLNYNRCADGSGSAAEVRALNGDRLSFRATAKCGLLPAAAARGSLSDFLLERYYAFTRKARRSFAFRVEHAPWCQVPAEVSLEETGLLRRRWGWFKSARLLGGHLSSGVTRVHMSVPRRADVPGESQRTSRSAFVL